MRRNLAPALFGILLAAAPLVAQPAITGPVDPTTFTQLKDFKARTRTNDAGNMTSVAQTISEEDIVDLAHFTAGL